MKSIVIIISLLFTINLSAQVGLYYYKGERVVQMSYEEAQILDYLSRGGLKIDTIITTYKNLIQNYHNYRVESKDIISYQDSVISQFQVKVDMYEESNIKKTKKINELLTHVYYYKNKAYKYKRQRRNLIITLVAILLGAAGGIYLVSK